MEPQGLLHGVAGRTGNNGADTGPKYEAWQITVRDSPRVTQQEPLATGPLGETCRMQRHMTTTAMKGSPHGTQHDPCPLGHIHPRPKGHYG
eukprot:6357073-Karenia_brevis.AAC.1